MKEQTHAAPVNLLMYHFHLLVVVVQQMDFLIAGVGALLAQIIVSRAVVQLPVQYVKQMVKFHISNNHLTILVLLVVLLDTIKI